MRKIDYYILDVFAKNKYGGNQLAVFIDLEDKIGDALMLKMAKEINFAESTFIKKRIADNKYAVRIFTTESEIPFAGHPTLGTSFVIANYLTDQAHDKVILDLMNDDIEVVLADKDQAVSSLYTMTQTQPRFLKEFDKVDITEGLGIDHSFLDDLAIQEVSTGLPFIIIPIKSLDYMNKIKLDPDQFKSFLLEHQIYKSNYDLGLSSSLLFFTQETFEKENDYNVRMFCLEDEILKEDSATGSANGCLTAYLLKFLIPKFKAKVEQGFQMERKSYLSIEGSRIRDNYDIKVGGYIRLISKGEWYY